MRSLLAALLTTLCAFSQEPVPDWHWQSMSGDLQAVAKFVDSDTPREIYVFESKHPDQRKLLCTFERDANINFSPDGKWIAMDDNLGSNVSEIRLFKRVSGITYDETHQKPDTVAWRLLRDNEHVPYPDVLFHNYAHVCEWSSNSQAFLLWLQGHNDMYQHVDQWFCVYNVLTGRASLNLRQMNVGSVTFKRHPGGKPERHSNSNRPLVAPKTGNLTPSFPS